MGLFDKIFRKTAGKTLDAMEHNRAERLKGVNIPRLAATPPIRKLGISAEDLLTEFDLFRDELSGNRDMNSPINEVARAVLLTAMQDDPVFGQLWWKQEHRDWFISYGKVTMDMANWYLTH